MSVPTQLRLFPADQWHWRTYRVCELYVM